MEGVEYGGGVKQAVMRGRIMVKVRVERQMKNLISAPQLCSQNNQKPCKGLSRCGNRRVCCQICKLERSLWMLGGMKWPGEIWRH